MLFNRFVFLGALPVVAIQLMAQSGSNPLSTQTKAFYSSVKGNILKSAEEMPEADYGYQPTSTVRTFGQLVGHVADGQYEFCSAVLADTAKAPEIEKAKTGKSDLIAALKTSYSYCDRAYDAMTDAQAPDSVAFFGRKLSKLSVLNFNISHNEEHYGNMVTYLRMKGLVPPTSKK